MVFTWEQARKRLAKSLLPFLKEIIMDYEKKYKEALERARVIHKLAKDGSNPIWYNYEEIFPELAESEDERIIKTIHEYIKNRNWMLNGPTQDEVLAWLEKQKKCHPDDVLNCTYQEGFEDGFKAGREVERRNSSDDDFMKPRMQEPWNKEKQKEEEGYEIIPVESTLEYKLGFNAGKESVKQKEQKPDDDVLHRTYQEGFDDGLNYRLKGIGVRYVKDEQKPVEWSEEDEGMLSRCIKSIDCSKQFADSEAFKKAKDKEIDWLNSLRPQLHWKPSEEQMEELNKARRFIPYNCDVIAQLYEDLKKLR